MPQYLPVTFIAEPPRQTSGHRSTPWNLVSAILAMISATLVAVAQQLLLKPSRRSDAVTPRLRERSRR
jgi:hypothetical protein